jgi:asparagine synthase (glutamine-hydrolysing)
MGATDSWTAGDGIRLVGPGWTTENGVAARGRAVDPTGQWADLHAAFEGASSVASVTGTARRLDGFFAAVVSTSRMVYLACDHARSIPLYFSTRRPVRVGDATTVLPGSPPGRGPVDTVDAGSSGRPRVARDPGTRRSNYSRRCVSDDRDPVAESEFALTRYVTRGETLRPDVRAVRAGEVVAIPRSDPSSFARRRYATYRPTTQMSGDLEALVDRTSAVLGRVFDRVADLAGDRRVAVPLSGGFDSRLVASLLTERGLDVLGFTFGVRGHADVEVSRRVADALGIDWEHVQYSTDAWHEWYHSDECRRYHEVAFADESLPFLAEWPAVRTLRAEGVLGDDTLVCPGHTVGTPSERVPSEWLDATPERADVLDYVFDEHYSLWEYEDPAMRAAFADRIAADADLVAVESPGEAAAAYEQWEWTTRMATFTHGDCRLYDWFGLDWWLPLWDPEYVRLWSAVPLEHRQGKTLQNEVAVRTYERVSGVDPDRARLTERDWTPLDQLRHTVESDPRRAVGGTFEDWFGTRGVPRSGWESWGNYPLGWYGVVPEADYDRFEAARNLYALRTLAALGLISFDPPRVPDSTRIADSSDPPALRRVIDLPPSTVSHSK